uniref:EH domain-containing protein n=1 Tax=Florenciella parvula TaxID=236787 RepID=A0A7S2C5Q8_9STRA|mmetsp:Transcript_24669/g.50927  ORF Transcript_24669/g.50927 Transcript_24669/m.50927 type:complete len:512 (+) Transcript_24669:199-1734(+)
MAQLVIDVPSPDKAPPALDPSTGLTPSFGAVAVNADAAALPSLDLGEAAASRPGGASPKGSMAAPPPRKSPRPEPDVANGKAVPPQKKPRLSFDSNEDVSGDNAEQAAAAAAAEVAAVAAEDAKGALNSARMLESTKDVAASVASVASAGTMAGTVAGIEEEKSSDAPPGQLSTSVAERDGWDVVVDEDAWQAKGAGEGEGEGQGQGQGDDKGQGAPPVEPTDAHMPVGLPGTQDAINLDTYDADADVEEEEAAAAAAGASASNAGDMGFEGSEGSDEDNLEPGDDGLPWVLPDASWFQDPAQGGATGGSDEGGEGGEGGEANKVVMEEPVLDEHDFEPVDAPVDPPAYNGHDHDHDYDHDHGEDYEDTAAIAASLNESDADLSRGAAKAAAAAAESALTQAPVLEPWVLDPLDPSLGEQLMGEAASYMQAYSAELTDGKLTPEVVRAILSQTGLPFSTLKDVWELADIDKDGLFDEAEFALALFLCRRVVNGALLPQTLHPTLIPPSKRR